MGTLKGVDPDGSQRAWDLFVKSRFIETINPGRALIMASGTPITNTMGELFTLQRYFAEDLLRARDIHSFDAWAANFGEAKTEMELQPSGLYKPATRFSEFVNVPELIDIFRHFADVVQKSDLRQDPQTAQDRRRQAPARDGRSNADVPRLPAGPRSAHQGDRGPEGAARKGRRHSAVRYRRRPPAAIDLRLVVSTLPNDPLSKLNMMIDRVEEIYHRTAGNIYYAQEGVPDRLRGRGAVHLLRSRHAERRAVRGFSVYR